MDKNLFTEIRNTNSDAPLGFVQNPVFVLLFAVVDVLFAVEGSSPVQYTVNDAIHTLTNGTGVISLGKAENGTGDPLCLCPTFPL